MRRLLLLVSLALLIATFVASGFSRTLTAQTPARRTIKLAYLFSDGNIPGTIKAFKALLAERPDLRGQVTLTFLTESVFDDTTAADITGANVLVLDMMNQQLVDRFNSKFNVDVINSVKKRGVVLAVGEGLLPRQKYVEMGAVIDTRAAAYWEHAGFENQLSLMKSALTRAGVKGLTMPDPQPSLDFGYYYPEGRSGRVFGDWESFDAWRVSRGKKHAGAPQIAVGFYKSTFYSGDADLLDKVIAEVEKHGADAVPVFGYPGAVATERLLVDAQGKSRADAMLGFFFNFADPESSKRLEKVDIPIVAMVSLYGRSEKEWRESGSGMTQFEGTFQVATPELAGTIAPTIVGSKEKIRDPETGLTLVVTHPILSRVTTAVDRALKYAALKSIPNAKKKIALIYYNYPPGKANIGASYLNVAESLANVLQRMKKDGYDVGDADLSSEHVLADITTKARNVGGYGQGELKEFLAQGTAARVSFAQYNAWLKDFAPSLRTKILKDWGAPEKVRLMADADGFVIPLVKYGNVLLMPQPSRAWGEDPEKMYHAKDLSPHPQYVATYAWLRRGYKADAVVHIGTHGTLEWLDGKDTGLSEEDAPDALIADLPDLYIYNVDVVGEGLVARRRGMAALVDHMVPPFRQGGLYPELVKLGELINDYTINESKEADLMKAYAGKIRDQVVALGIAKDLALDVSKEIDEEAIHKIENHLIDLKSQNIPYGLHAFGRTPAKELRESTVSAIVSVDRSILPKNAKILADDMEKRIVESGPRELDNLARGLRGGYLPGGGGGEPIRNPDAYPTGKNFYGIDPDKVPKPASWDIGVKLADQMLADHVKKHGKYPEKVSFVIWGDETMRHEGVLESQIFHLLGTKPVWDVRGKVVDVEVIPQSQLGRPRVDIVIASAAEGMFHNVTMLMDQAVQKVKAIEEADNFVRRHYLATKTILMERGYSEQDADRRAGVRIFDEPPGYFNLNTSTIVANSGTWDSDKGFADDYIRKLGHGYGNGFWGESMADVFKLALSGTEKVVHSSSTALYGALDNDDMFMYVGGLAAAIRNVDGGKSPEIVVTNTRNPGKPEMTTIDKFIGTEFRSRYVNPTWIEGMKKEGYAGAGAMREFVEYMWGWDATVPEVVDDAMWKETFDVYVEDKHNLGMKQFFENKSPYAYQDITARMVENTRKGYWKADEETKKKLLQEYVESVNKYGASGAETTTGNARLMKYVMEEGKKAGIPVPALDQFSKTMQQATGQTIAAAAQKEEAFAKKNDAREASEHFDPAAPVQQAQAPAPQAPTPNPPAAQSAAAKLEGYLMEQEKKAQQALSNAAPSRTSAWQGLYVAVPLLAILVAWYFRRRHIHA